MSPRPPYPVMAAEAAIHAFLRMKESSYFFEKK
jgi:hypothetical protein